MPCFILFSRFIIDLSFKIKGVSSANKINYIYIYNNNNNQSLGISLDEL